MCDKCQERRDEMWTEIRDILNFNRRARGPMSEMLAEGIESFCNEHPDYTEEQVRTATDGIRAQLIALRCAFIARSCPETEWHGAPPSIVLGAWAGEAMQHEQMHSAGYQLIRRLFEGD